NADVFLIDELREQVGGTVYLAHRLDRATSGVLLIARSSEIAAALGEQFMGRDVHKQYLTVVRGWPEPEEGVIDYPLPGSRETGPRKDASTRYPRLATRRASHPAWALSAPPLRAIAGRPRNRPVSADPQASGTYPPSGHR